MVPLVVFFQWSYENIQPDYLILLAYNLYLLFYGYVFDGVDDVEAYNNYDEMLLFTYFPKKISVVEKNLPKDILT